jgi:antitoxin MazE
MKTQIRRVGNSLGSIIPAPLVRQLELTEGVEIDVQVKEGAIILTPLRQPSQKLPYSEAELLSGINAFSTHADELAAPSSSEWDNE